jgi:hypothetical protein
VASHWEPLERVLLEAGVDGTWQEAIQSVRKMHNIKLNQHPNMLVQTTLAEIDRRAARYVANWTKSEPCNFAMGTSEVQGIPLGHDLAW